jgi:hypothetical protein
VDTVLLRRLYVLFFIHHDTRLVRIAGVTAKPVTDWVTQQARDISMDTRPGSLGQVPQDRDTKFTRCLPGPKLPGWQQAGAPNGTAMRKRRIASAAQQSYARVTRTQQ